MWSGKLRGGEAWRADVSCVSFHIPLQLQRKKRRGIDNGGGLYVWEQEVYGKSLYLSLNFAVKLKLL